MKKQKQLDWVQLMHCTKSPLGSSRPGVFRRPGESCSCCLSRWLGVRIASEGRKPRARLQDPCPRRAATRLRSPLQSRARILCRTRVLARSLPWAGGRWFPARIPTLGRNPGARGRVRLGPARMWSAFRRVALIAEHAH